MKLDKGTIRPGTVIEVFENGQIKASAPGLFNMTDDPALLPPIYPWFIGNNCNAYSKPLVNDTVWIMNFSDNPQQLYWFRKDNNNVVDNIPMGETNVDVLCNREIGAEWATIYFSDGSGWIIGKGDSIIQIRKNGSIMLNANMPHRCIDINGQNISIGSEGKSKHSAAYGDATVEVLTDLCVMLQGVAIKAMASPYTMAIGTNLFAKLPPIIKKISDIPSQHVTID